MVQGGSNLNNPREGVACTSDYLDPMNIDDMIVKMILNISVPFPESTR